MKLSLTIKDEKKGRLLVDLLKEISFIEIGQEEENSTSNQDINKFFGIWKNKSIKAEELRKQGWSR